MKVAPRADNQRLLLDWRLLDAAPLISGEKNCMVYLIFDHYAIFLLCSKSKLEYPVAEEVFWGV